jgi:hypothetical protein
MRTSVSAANGAPVLVLDRLHDGRYRPHGVLVLELDGERVAGIDAFIGPGYRALFRPSS